MVVLLAAAVTLPVLIKSRPRGNEAAPAAFVVNAGPVVTVSISGDVRHAGVYRVPVNTMTISAIKLAQPLSRMDSENQSVFITKQVHDGATFRLLRNSDGLNSLQVGSIPSAQRIVLGIPLDINEMSAEDFDRLPGIGPSLAKRIIEYRQSIGGKLCPDDLLSVDGIGEKKFQQIRRFF